MQSPATSPFGRRAFLTGLGASALVVVTGCSNPFSSAPTTRTVTSEAPPPVEPLQTLLATTRLHLARIDAGLLLVAADPNLAAYAAVLTLARSDRAAHLAALDAEVARTSATPTDSSASTAPAGSSQTITLPPDSDVQALVLQDCVEAQTQFRDGVQNTSRYRAALYGSISACLASHRLVLQPS